MEQQRPSSPATAPHLRRGGAGVPSPQPPFRRHRRSSSSASSSSTAASYSPPLPNSFSSAIPFSWEFRPGVPKIPLAVARSSDREMLLPPPPPLRIRSSAAALKKPDRDPAPAPDPFAAAFAECSMAANDAAAFARRREIIPADAVSGGILLYWLCASSCKTSVAVSESTTAVRAARSALQDRRRRRSR